jgi:hypothetical protein
MADATASFKDVPELFEVGTILTELRTNARLTLFQVELGEALTARTESLGESSMFQP